MNLGSTDNPFMVAVQFSSLKEGGFIFRFLLNIKMYSEGYSLDLLYSSFNSCFVGLLCTALVDIF